MRDQMPSHGPRRKSTLFQGLDQQIYPIVLKYVDEATQYHDSHPLEPSVPLIYQHIHKSNSSLARKSKKLLESSIGRVIQVIKDDAESEDEIASLEGDLERITSPSNGVNKSIVGLWETSTAKPDTVTPPAIPAKETQPAPSLSKKRNVNGEPPAKRRKAAPEFDRSPPMHIRYRDLGGVDAVKRALNDTMLRALLDPHVFMSTKTPPPRGVLLHGPPGCGKTMMANAFAAEVGVPFIPISAPSIVSGMSGESEKALRDVFEEAKKTAPCIIFIDEIDAVTPKRDTSQREMEKRIVAQLLTCMDDLSFEKTGGKAVIVLAATNRPDALDPALRRGGRFDKEINMGVPSEAVREAILRTLTRDMPISGELPFRDLAKRTPGFVGADLRDLVSTAGSDAIQRDSAAIQAERKHPEVQDSHEMELDTDATASSEIDSDTQYLVKRLKESTSSDRAEIFITQDDFYQALPKIQPSAKREGFTTIPEITWADIGALGPVRKELQRAIVEPIKNPADYKRVGITAPTGVLLWGPPGCGKTLLAQAVAFESGAAFISVKGPELLNKYVGESEKAVRSLFGRAKSSTSCVIFFDEFDALVPKRENSGSDPSVRVVNALLTELDGLSKREGIYVIAATNRPDMIDLALLRPGRFGKLLFVDLPGATERAEILKTRCQTKGVDYNDAVGDVARACKGFSGADLESLLLHAGYAAMERKDIIRLEDFQRAQPAIRVSVSDRRMYQRLEAQWGNGISLLP